MKRWAFTLSLVIGALPLGTAALAQDLNLSPTGPAGSSTPTEGIHGLELGVRVGYGVPFGTSGDTTSMSDAIKGMIPFWADVGYRIDSNWYLGGFFQFGLGLLPSNAQQAGCNIQGVSCSENNLRFGVNVHYHILPNQTLDPWVGIGAGYEILNISASAQGISTSVSTRGFEFGNAQLGLDYKVSSAFGVGPFVTFTIAQFSDLSASLNGQDVQGVGITNKKIHEWLIFGLRGVFDLSFD
jgi:hypothetical protein